MLEVGATWHACPGNPIVLWASPDHFQGIASHLSFSAFFPSFIVSFVQIEADLCDEANCGLVGFPLSSRHLGCFEVLKSKFTIHPFRPQKCAFLHSKKLRFRGLKNTIRDKNIP